jgi:hypothetical protein
LGGEHLKQAPFGLLSKVCTYPKQDGRPVAGMVVPAITSNQPSRRVRCVQEWT